MPADSAQLCSIATTSHHVLLLTIGSRDLVSNLPDKSDGSIDGTVNPPAAFAATAFDLPTSDQGSGKGQTCQCVSGMHCPFMQGFDRDYPPVGNWSRPFASEHAPFNVFVCEWAEQTRNLTFNEPFN